MVRKTSLRRRSFHCVAWLLAVSVALGACSGFTQKIKRRFGGKVSFDVEVDSRLNNDFPLAVDFVVVYDKGIYAELKKMSASDWFAQRDQYRTDNEPARLVATSWEWVPPPCLSCPGPGTQTVEYRIGAQGAVVFTNYFNPGVHRIVVEPLEAFTLTLSEKKAAKEDPPDKKKKKKKKKDATP